MELKGSITEGRDDLEKLYFLWPLYCAFLGLEVRNVEMIGNWFLMISI